MYFPPYMAQWRVRHMYNLAANIKIKNTTFSVNLIAFTSVGFWSKIVCYWIFSC